MAGFFEAHLDALLTGFGSLLVFAIVHGKTFGKLQHGIDAIESDVSEMKGSMRLINRRFHHVNGYAMSLYACVRLLASKLGETVPEIKPYDYSEEDEGGI